MNIRYVRPATFEEPYGLRHDLLERIKVYLKSTKIIAQSVPNMHFSSDVSIKDNIILLSKLIATITLHRLNHAVEVLEKRDVSKRLADEDVALFKAVFDGHLKLINSSRSPINYTASPHMAINDILCKIAKDIDQMTGTPWLKLLISSLDDDNAHIYSTKTFRFKNAVLSPDNKKIIPVDMVKDEKSFKALPPKDQEALLSHSPQAMALHLSRSHSGEFPRVPHQSMIGGVSASAPIPMVSSVYVLADGRVLSVEASREADLELSLLDSSAAIKVDTASMVALMSNLEPHLRGIFSTQKELCDFMMTHLPDRKDWQILVDILSGTVLDKLFPQPSTSWFGFFNNTPAGLAVIADNHHLAMWFCVNAAYQKRRVSGPDYDGFEMGQDVSKSKGCKVAGASFIMNAILKGQGYAEIYAALEQPEHQVVKASLTTGSLGQINRTFLDCAEWEYKLPIAARSFGK